ncbi:hypothetical protein GCU49_21140, partial [Modestobacter roseus]|nr:hypothetical protein [Modestobacter roseus]
GLRDGGCYNHFERGSIYWTAATGAQDITGAIRDRWAAIGWEGSHLGYPTTGQTCGLQNGGCFNHFQRGSIYYSPATNAWDIGNGPIRSKWAATGYENGPLGYPTSPQYGMAQPNHFHQYFSGDAIMYSTPGAPAAYYVQGPIRAKYAAMNWERSYLGFPTSDPTNVNGGSYNDFQGGSIYHSPATGAHPVTGQTRDLWLAAGGVESTFGYPRSAERPISEGKVQEFVGTTLFTDTNAIAVPCTVMGTSGPDIIVGTAGPDIICALGGDDRVEALGGDDIVFGGPGNDWIDLGEGDDSASGQAGNDVIIGGLGNDTIRGGTGDDRLIGGQGDDDLSGEDGGDVLTGGDGADLLRGGSGDDTLEGDEGDDVLHGDDGHDLLSGGAGTDLIYGGLGEDRLNGDVGDDTLNGGPSKDISQGGSGIDICTEDEESGDMSDCETIRVQGPADAVADMVNAASPSQDAEMLQPIASDQYAAAQSIDSGATTSVMAPSASTNPVLLTSKDASGQTTQLGVQLPDLATSQKATTAQDGTTVYGAENDDSLTVQKLGDESVRFATVISSAAAPTRYEYEMSLPPTARMTRLADGSVEIRGTNGTLIGAVSAPWAKDVNGTGVPTRYEVIGTTLVQVVEHTKMSYAYPVVADPRFTWGWITGTAYFNKKETRLMAGGSYATALALLVFVPGVNFFVLWTVGNVMAWAVSARFYANTCLKVKYGLAFPGPAPTVAVVPGHYKGAWCF